MIEKKQNVDLRMSPSDHHPLRLLGLAYCGGTGVLLLRFLEPQCSSLAALAAVPAEEGTACTNAPADHDERRADSRSIVTTVAQGEAPTIQAEEARAHEEVKADRHIVEQDGARLLLYLFGGHLLVVLADALLDCALHVVRHPEWRAAAARSTAQNSSTLFFLSSS